MSSTISPPQSLLKPINVPSKTLMGPGPSSGAPRVLAAGALPLLGHLHSEFTQIMDECKEGIRYLFQTNNTVTLAVSGTGHAGMEMACDNTIEPGDKVLVVTNGIWGSRFSDMASRHGGDVVQLTNNGHAFSKDELEKALVEHKPSVMFVAHSESSCTLMQPVDDLGHLCHKYDCILIVDTVASAGGAPLFMDKWGE
ncbi:AGXT [Bugula neritina]|uniref:AGXT n=1 Tax=Bugula neritina TaxID=10212 RepID=A0A7J7JVP0_BUGNE|nr:AGXT [Bugula neritina]